jgi:hypothetical protein
MVKGGGLGHWIRLARRFPLLCYVHPGADAADDLGVLTTAVSFGLVPDEVLHVARKPHYLPFKFNLRMHVTLSANIALGARMTFAQYQI